ncbi:glycosyl hydrolase [Paenibacillaceae bacterium WGS1546]|uniref:glycosyl hydrolase n=1 Tax=Cohnella sp. WGS1546 TaxID=3366810 RepID=UPI00372D095F
MKRKLAALAVAIAAVGMVSCDLREEQQTEWTFEAENGALGGVETASASAGFSGDGYVTGFDAEEDSLAIIIDAPDEGLYELRVGYRSPNGEKTTRLSLNGKPFGEMKLKPSDTFAETEAGKLLLAKGINELRFHSYWGWYDIDYVTVSKAPPRPKHRVPNKLVNPAASREALALHRFLIERYGTHILAGQQTLKDALQLSWDYGKLPAVVGFDLIDYSPSRQENGAVSNEIENMLQWHEMGGIATLAWHWNAPFGLIDSAEQPWWRGFYAEATTFDLEAALADPDSEEYRLLLRDIDAIAVQLQRLQEARIPVLWRPLHEAEGGWFWWGAQGPEPAKQLWHLLYDRLTNRHGIHNLIWIWNSEDAEWYPGDDTVDIVSVDSYPQPGDYNPVSRSYENLVKLVKDEKLVALTENGPIPDPELLIRYEAHWSWFCTWSGEFIQDGVQNSKEHIRYVLEHEYVITLDELPDFRGG